MINLGHTYDDEHVVFTAKHPSPGFFARMLRTSTPSPDLDEWAAGDTARCDGLGALRQYGEIHPDTVRIEADRVVATHAAVAALTAGQARSLGLPGRSPFALAADTSGVIGSADFELHAHWTDADRAVVARRRGAFLETAQGTFLIPDPQFSLVELADGFEAGSVGLPDHWDALARFRRLLDSDHESNESAEMSTFLRDLRIYTGTALSLALTGTADDLDFDPVLFDPEAMKAAEEDGRVLSEQNGILPAELLDTFQSHAQTGFRTFDAAKRSYLLGRRSYLIIDDDLETALQLVREMQQAGPAERRAFAANPRAALAERLAARADGASADADGDDIDEDIEARVADLFIETPEYADRAIGIGLWQPPRLEFLPRPSNEWLPESFALELGGVWVNLMPETVTGLRAEIEAAIAEGISHVSYQGNRIPATPEVREKLASVVGTQAPEPTPPEETSDPRSGNDEERPDRTVVIVHENFVEENWAPQGSAREGAAVDVPDSIRTSLLDHQREALEWQVEGWRAGHPGLLNADDQGLGKTLQTLAFLAWLKARMSEAPDDERRPVLVVAPTGLLRTWQAEEEKHLTGTRLGARIDAYGPGLRDLRAPGLAGRDTDDGAPRLAFEALRASIERGSGHEWWVLTTYETLANYQHSFRNIHFSAVVFDEIQKIKNAKTLMALAARGVRADFRIGLTGTPLENHVADLWAVMDAVVPGRLHTLKQFLEKYGEVTEEKMRELHARVFRPIEAPDRRYPPVGQRRLKEDVLAGLPRKDFRVYPATMPSVQAQAYELARQHLVDGARGAALKLLHHIRGVSLHPEPPDTVQDDLEVYFARSARFDSVRRILGRIHARGERVLIFTEHRRMQAFVAQWIRSEFGLDEVRIINGATTIAGRRACISAFQNHLESDGGFDVLILSPRAAGVGLTLTAATHVIHLSRWWNPAVEEQCNDRIYRIGQKHDVTIHLPLAIHPAHRERSFDCVLNDLMRRKRSLARAALWPPTLSDVDNAALVTEMSGADAFDPTEIDSLDWHGFEHWIVVRARESGDWEASETPRSGDGGADALLRHRRRRATVALVRAKHTTQRDRPAGEAAVRDLLRARDRYALKHPQLVAITNAVGFTDDARALALEHEVALVDRDRLGLWPNHVLA
ncbi:MAG: SNF2-related protein [Thiotrichales bacterium]|nr:SNF2-related protein [Thiotrichales bacterium]